MKKHFQSIASSLAPLAEELPVQRPPKSFAVVEQRTSAAKAARAADDPLVQFTMDLRKSQRRQLRQLADDADMTVRAFILDALRGKGLDVTEADLEDLRKKRS